MSRKTILFADNDPDFLQTRAEFLQNEGYQVVFANSPEHAEQLLHEINIHLAILDIRLTNDDNEKDISGVLLAQNEDFRNIPKIILTGFPSPYTSRDVLMPHRSGFRPAINYVGKEEGPSKLIAAVNESFHKHVRINWDLTIDWRERDSFSLIRLIESNLVGEQLLHRAQELDDLLRRLFFEDDYIRIERLLWKGDGRVAIIVFTFKEGMRPESYVVVCGRNSIINDEAQRFEQFAPGAPGDMGTRLTTRTETSRYAANAYTFANIDLEKAQSLNELYHNATPKLFKDALTTLFQRTLAEWHQDKLIHVEKPLSYLYQHRLQLTDSQTLRADFEGRIQAIEKQAHKLRLTISHTDEEVSFNLGEKVFSYPVPIHLLFETMDAGEALIINVPGLLTGQNILTNGTGYTWLTDFAAAGHAPLFWNYVALESIIRFDWTNTDSFLRRKELEDCLINGDFVKPDIRNLETEVLKPAQAIAVLRRLAKQTIDRAAREYHLGLFYQAARFLLDYNPALPLQQLELLRLVHIYLSMAMLTKKIVDHRSDRLQAAATPAVGIAILDKKARLILVGAREVHLTPQYFAVFHYLFERVGEVCTKEELINKALKGEYAEEYIQTIVMRIRKEIEDDPERPRYLVTEPYAGYRLILNPK